MVLLCVLHATAEAEVVVTEQPQVGGTPAVEITNTRIARPPFVHYDEDAFEKLRNARAGTPGMRWYVAYLNSLIFSRNNGTPSSAPLATPAADQNSDAGTCTNPTTQHPVVVSTGEKFKDEPDFQSFGNYGLSLTRTYRSQRGIGWFFGPRWTMNLDPRKLTPFGGCRRTDSGCYPYFIKMYEPGGAEYTYALDANAELYTINNNAAMGYMIWSSPSNTYTLRRDRMTYRFNKALFALAEDGFMRRQPRPIAMPAWRRIGRSGPMRGTTRDSLAGTTSPLH